MKKTIGQLCPVSDTEHYSFWIPAYQRGYRWTPTEVEDLLLDIDSSYKANPNRMYCLQPLIVKHDPDKNRWEVIDGQQRLTTIYLILCVLCYGGRKFKYLFSIETERETEYRLLEGDELSKRYQDGIKSISNIFNAIKEIAKKQNDKEYSNRDYCEFFNRLFEQEQKCDDHTNIDRYYILQALTTICNHYYGKDQYFDSGAGRPGDETTLVTYLKEKFYFLWYEEKSMQSSEETFARFNSGKISLTNADLIKALLLRKENLLTKKENKKDDSEGDQNYNHRIDKLLDNRRVEIISEWDNMEQIMRSDDDRFWYFIADLQNIVQNGYFSRLELIFEIEMLGNDEKFLVERRNTQYDIYRFFEKLSAETNTGDGDEKNKIWKEVKKDFNTLREWYEDPKLYHYIGFLSCLDPNDFKGQKFAGENFPDGEIRIYWTDILARLLKVSRNMKKDDFRKSVETLIRDIISNKINGAIKNNSKVFESTIKEFKDEQREFAIRNFLEHLAYNFNDSDEDADDDVVKDNQLIRELLLLANIQELVTSKDQLETEHKFPFKLWKKTARGEEKSEQLTLEHIQPQHPKLTAKNNALLSGDDLEAEYDKIHGQLKQICSEIQDDDNIDKKTKEEKDGYIRKLIQDEWKTALGDDPVQHPQRIYNLTLLQHGDNAALGNKWFFSKRNDILDIARNKKYIPVSTKHVFLKAYSCARIFDPCDSKCGESGSEGISAPTEEQSQDKTEPQIQTFSLRLWEEKDAQAYLDALAGLLDVFYVYESAKKGNDNQ